MYGIKDYVEPVAGKMRITSGQGPRKARRTTNGNMMSSFHHGVDIAGGTPGSKPPIRNVTAGKVVFVGNAGGWGKTVIVENPDGFRVQYGHLDSFNVKVGDQVAAGQNIGIMGATGNVTGVHLDMIVTRNGKTIRRDDGGVLADAPASIAKRAGGKLGSTSSTPDTPTPSAPASSSAPTQNIMVGNTTQQQPIEQPTQQQPGQFDLFGGGLNLLSGAVGLAVPTTQTENQLFGGIANMNLDGGLEQIYAEAARAIASAKDSISSQPMIQSNNPLRTELGAIFDRIDV